MVCAAVLVLCALNWLKFDTMKKSAVYRVYAYDEKNNSIGFFRFSAKDFKDGVRQFFEFAEMVSCDQRFSVRRIDLYCGLHCLFTLSDVRRFSKLKSLTLNFVL